jgi:hypothetical protein
MDTINLEGIKSNFYQELIGFSDRLHLEFIENDKQQLNSFFTLLLKNAEDYTKLKEIEEYNVFNILRYGHYETRLHTPMLVNLLNPHERHYIGDVFFKEFINFIFNHQLINKTISEIEVIEELNDINLEGRIDIFISFKCEGQIYYIAIENKINANDQEKQLERYFAFLKLKSNDLSKLKLVYLTKHGVHPSLPYSISNSLYCSLVQQDILIKMSFKSDIVKLLDVSINQKINSRVKETINQYKQLLKSF